MSQVELTTTTGQLPSVLDVAREMKSLPVAIQLRKIGEEVRQSPVQIARAFMRLSFGEGKASFEDFVKLRLFDPAFHPGADLQAFAGQKKNRNICVTVNYRHDWFGLMSNKVAATGYLSAYGLPVIQTQAIFAPRLARPGSSVLRDRESLHAFLMRPSSYPMFGKPCESYQSLGSMGLLRINSDLRKVEMTDGRTVPLDHVMSAIETHYSDGYLFQSLMKPESSISALCGGRLACLRVVTALTEEGPRVLRAIWKIPAGQNIADNYWRTGNLLAQVAKETGSILNVTSGIGFDTRSHSHHPDTGVGLIGFQHPEWESMLKLAVEGANVMKHVPLIGWDLALTQEGPTIVEMNEMPDFFLVQFADRRGMLDQQFKEFMAFQARNAEARWKYTKECISKL